MYLMYLDVVSLCWPSGKLIESLYIVTWISFFSDQAISWINNTPVHIRIHESIWYICASRLKTLKSINHSTRFRRPLFTTIHRLTGTGIPLISLRRSVDRLRIVMEILRIFLVNKGPEIHYIVSVYVEVMSYVNAHHFHLNTVPVNPLQNISMW